MSAIEPKASEPTLNAENVSGQTDEPAQKRAKKESDEGLSQAPPDHRHPDPNPLIGEGGVVMRQMVYQQRDEVNVLFGGIPAAGVPPQAAHDRLEPLLDVARASKGMRLSGGKGDSAAAGGAVG